MKGIARLLLSTILLINPVTNLFSLDLKDFNAVNFIQGDALHNTPSLCEKSKKKFEDFTKEVGKRAQKAREGMDHQSVNAPPSFSPTAYLLAGGF